MSDVYGLTGDQHKALGVLLGQSGNIVREEAPPVIRRGVVSEFARVMTLDFPTYSPREPRQCALFYHDPDSVTVTVKFFGESLAGDVLLNFGNTTIRLDCRSTTEQLRYRLGLSLAYCRATVFPGLWEFAFVNPDKEPPDITVDTYYTGNVPFLGGVVVTREGWTSATEDGDTFVKIDVIDAVPFRRGQVKAGAIALAQAYGADQFMVAGWNCPEFTFKSL